MGIVLEAKGLTKSYQSGKQKIKVLKNIDAVFEEGLFYAITGRSGSGKSTLLHILSGLEKPEILFADEPTGNLDKKTANETLELLLECSYRYGQTLILVTHDMEIAERADDILKIEDGRICETQFQ